MAEHNRLIHEKSPYLLQHAGNPVDWYPWGDEAFAKALAEDKPVFLSVGYSTCHWCHVMAHESFENQEVARVLNQGFVSIKVDREEHTDVDGLYMTATWLLNGSGGWPMSVFLFPDGRPFYGGSYIPLQSGPGRPGFPDLLKILRKLWDTQRQDLESAANQVVANLQQQNRAGTKAMVADDILATCFVQLRGDYDRAFGGFGAKPKFPRPVVLNFLLRYWLRTRDKQALDMVLKTLRAMAAGGIHDHLGGGFHRYSVDEQWLVPHFEKMLYDQAQLAESYLDAFQITGDVFFAEVAERILEYVLRDLHDPAGGFFCAEDADSEEPGKPGERREGAFYLWKEEEIATVLGRDRADIFSYCYDIRSEGNIAFDPQHEFTGKNIPHVVHSSAAAAESFALPQERIVRDLEESRQLLFRARTQRNRPGCDDKVITAWNGMMIGAMARGGSLLHRPEFVEAAEKAASFIRERLFNEHDKRLLRRYRDGEAAIEGQLDDYAFLVAGLLQLSQVCRQPCWLQWAVALTRLQIDKFWDEEQGGFFDSVENPRLIVRTKSARDGAEPSANSVTAMNLLKLGALSGNRDWHNKAAELLAAFGDLLNQYPTVLAEMVCAVDQLREGTLLLVIAGERDATDTKNMLEAADKWYDPGRLVLLADNGANEALLSEWLPFLHEAVRVEGKATAYLVEDSACRVVAHNPDELLRFFQSGVVQPA